MTDTLPTWTAVVAMTPRGVIGRDGDMPWRLSSDLRRFKRLTMGGTLIMGRKTFDSIGRPLPGRRTIVLTRRADWSTPGVATAASPDQAIELAGPERTFVVGGAQIYRELLPRCQQLWLTRVWSTVEGDTTLSIDMSPFEIIAIRRIPASMRDEVPTEFVQMSRRVAADGENRDQRPRRKNS